MKLRNLMIATAALSTMASAAAAQNSASVNVPTKVKFVEPIVVATAGSADLNFGTIARAASGEATVTIDASTGDRSISGATGVALAGGTVARAQYTAAGTSGETVSISLTKPALGAGLDVTPTLAGMTLTGEGPYTTTATLGGSPTELNIGGTLEIDSTATPTPGTVLSANMSLTVAYN